MAMLEITNLSGGYNASNALDGISLEVREGQTVSLLGVNGAGKTTTLKAISGLLPRATGSIVFDGVDLSKLRPDQRSGLGVAHVPEGRHVFPTLSVRDNLAMGAWTQRAGEARQLEIAMELFPKLKERSKQMAGTLSGGEMQMLAIGRALMGKPKLLILDEPTMGLSPKIVGEVMAAIKALRAEGMTMLIVEQFIQRALALSDYGYVLQRGVVAMQGSAEGLASDPTIQATYLT